MRKLLSVGIVSLAALTGCGLENLFSNLGHQPGERPASKISGAAAWGAAPYQFQVVDGNGTALKPFELSVGGGSYEIRLPSSTYSMVRVQARAGHLLLRSLVPSLRPETAVSGVDLDARAVTETLIVEANLSATGQNLTLLSPSAYHDPVTGDGTRKKIRAAFDVAGPTQELLRMVERLIAGSDPLSGNPDPGCFFVPVLDDQFLVVKTPAIDGSPLSENWLTNQVSIDYTGDGTPDQTTTAFDTLLGQVAKLYKPQGCPDDSRIRLVFTVDFNPGCISGGCGPLDRFLWTTDKPGKTMYFVGWVHKDSDIQDPAVGKLIGNSVPNQLAMHDDGTNGDEVAGDGVYTIFFDVPRDPAGVKKLRIGYKYTWGFQGQLWNGSEEWPGNSRIIQVDDLGPIDPLTGKGDGFVYRRDVYQDEASNKDLANLNTKGNGTLGWDQDLRGCGIPEAREQKFENVTPGNMCTCGTSFYTPPNLGTINVACK